MTGVRHSSEVALDKAQITLRVDLELKHRILQKYGKKGDNSKGLPYIRALEAAVDGVCLSIKAKEEVRKEMQANYEKRMAHRAKVNKSFHKNRKDYSQFGQNDAV